LRLQDGRGGVQTWFLASGKQSWEGLPAGRITANSPELLIRLACAGSGIAAVPDLVAAPNVERGELTRLLHAWSLPSDLCWAVFPGSRLMPAKTRVFIDMLRAALSPRKPSDI
jgi:DNA-binding transcriptional LysR family regulator